MDEFEVWVGIDWGSESHQVCVMDSGRNILLECAVRHSGEALVGLTEKLTALAGGHASRLAVAIEVPRGPVVETLLEKGISVFAINPKQLDRFRDRHTVAGAKDDRRDALVLADSLRTDMPAFRRVRPSDAFLVQLRELSRTHDELKAAKLRAAGHSHARALRTIGDRLLAVLMAVLKTGIPYDPNRRRAVPELGSPPPEPTASAA